MIRKISIIGALVAALVAMTLFIAPPSASTTNLAEKVSASSVPEKGDVPLPKSLKLGTFSNITQQLKTRESLSHSIRKAQARTDKRKDEAWVDSQYVSVYSSPSYPVATGNYGSPPAYFTACVINIESGGYPSAYNSSSGASGLFGIELPLWLDYGYSWYSITSQYPGGAYTAPSGIQREVFAMIYAAEGDLPWGPYDNCWVNGVGQIAGATPLMTHGSSLHVMALSSAPLHRERDRTIDRAQKAFRWAMRNAKGCPYSWGGASCSPGYDCSGMVMMAYQAVDIYLPHNTQLMVDSGHLVRIKDRNARKGDIVMYFGVGGAYHTGLVAYKTKWMLDAPTWGQNVKLQRIWGDPVFYRVQRRT